MELPFERVVVVSATAGEAITRLLAEHPAAAQRNWAVVSSLDALLEEEQVAAAVVANSARSHVATARKLLGEGAQLLVEKPVALSSADAQSLVSSAMAAGIKLVPGLQYRFCSYLHRFAEEVRRLPAGPRAFSLAWSDRTGEVRYGEAKSYDSSLNVAEDIMPHVWTILATVLARDAFRVESCRIEGGGRLAVFNLADETLRGDVTLERDASERRRLLVVRSSSDESVAIDFSEEPGTIVATSGRFSGDADWGGNPRPLARQLAYFFSTETDAAADRRACLASVDFAETASTLLRDEQRAMLEAALRQNKRLGADGRYALRELLAGKLIERGLARPGDNAAIDTLANEAAEALQRKARGRLAGVLRELGL